MLETDCYELQFIYILSRIIAVCEHVGWWGCAGSTVTTHEDPSSLKLIQTY